MDLDHLIPNDISVTEFIFRRIKGYENQVGTIQGDTGEEWTHGQLKTYVHNVGSAFTRRGMKKGDIVAVVAPNNLDHLSVFLGVPAIGGIISGMNPTYTTEEIQHHIQDCTASYVVTCPEILPKILKAVKKCPLVKEIILIGEVEGYTSVKQMQEDDGSCFPKIEIDASNDLAYLPYSSGTTGLPKGVMVSHQALMIQTFLFAEYKDYAFFKAGSRFMSMFPFYHAGGMMLCAYTIYQRSMSVVIENFVFEKFLQLIEKYRIESSILPPPVLLRLAKDPVVDKYDLSSFRSIAAGAAPISEVVERELCQRLKLPKIRQVYGMTEACVATHIIRVGGPAVYGAAGACHPMIPCKIIDIDSGRKLPPGEKGEVCVYTSGRLKGYWNNPEKTKTVWDKEGWLHTGDIGYLDENDNLYIIDRLKELIKYKGFQVAPAELEGLLLSHPDIADAAVIGIPDDRAGQVPAAYVVMKEGKVKDARKITAFVAEHAASYKHLRGGVVFIDAIPKSQSGKILRKILREKAFKELKVTSKI